MKTIMPSELKARLDRGEQPIMIDVREDDEVAFGIIPGAQHIAMGFIPARLDDIPQQGEVIFICRSGNRSGRVCEYLDSLGYEGATNLTGGMLEWVKL